MKTEERDESGTGPLDSLTTYDPPVVLWEEQFEVSQALRCSCCLAPAEGGLCDSTPGGS